MALAPATIACHAVGMNQRTILVVEDNESDELLVLRGIRGSGLGCAVVVAHDGEEACDALFGSRTNFSLVLLDLSLPKLNGLEVLERIREHHRTAHLPVVMFSSSDELDGIRRAIELGANSYVRKEVDFPLYEVRLKLLLYYWLAIHLPAIPGESTRWLRDYELLAAAAR
jgi:two-component system response regulator